LLGVVVIFATSCTVIGPKAFIHAVSKSSNAHISERQFSAFWASWWWVFVKGYHALEYAVLAVLLLWRVRAPAWCLLGFSVLCAASDEYHQTFVPARGGRVTDVLIDSGGILAGAGCFWLVMRLRRVVKR
jgi:hypothetical protein